VHRDAALEQLEAARLFVEALRHADDGAPAALGAEELPVGGQLRGERRAIRLAPLRDAGAKRRGVLLEQ
jgi:hypothetical protein